MKVAVFEQNDRGPARSTCDVSRTRVDGDHEAAFLEGGGPLGKRQAADHGVGDLSGPHRGRLRERIDAVRDDDRKPELSQLGEQ